MAKRILLVAATTGYQTRMFADAARRAGFDLALATDRCHVLEDPWRDQAIPVRFDDPDSASISGPFDGILAVGDRPAFVASVIAGKLGLPYNSPDSVEAARNKFLARQRFQAAGLPVPEFFRVPLDFDPRESAAAAPYPCVLKPLGLSASRGVIRADNPAEFIAAFHRIGRLLERPEIRQQRDGQNRYVQVESFIPGKEYALEGVLTNGCLQTLAVFEKPDPLDGPFFEETIYLTPPRANRDRQEAEGRSQRPDSPSQPPEICAGPPLPDGRGSHESIIAATERAIRALGLTLGPIHAELRDGQVLEVAARPIGGLCAKSLRFDGGMPLEELLIRHAAGEDVSHLKRERSASGVMMIPIETGGVFEAVSGVEEALAVAGVEEIEITAKAGQTLERLPEGSSYLGFIFARGQTPEDVERSLRGAHARLHFQIAAKLPVMR